MFRHSFPAFGSSVEVTVWDALPDTRIGTLVEAVGSYLTDFDRTFSRFRADSLVASLGTSTGTFEVGPDMIAMLRLYQRLYDATDGRFTPAVGGMLADSGYDAAYSLRPNGAMRAVPPLGSVLTIEDGTHLTLHEPVLLDFGALGKGYAVDRITDLLCAGGATRADSP
jgi:thiamine biosynthesis lipoprotein